MGLLDLGAIEIKKYEGKKQGQFSAIFFNQSWSVNYVICWQGDKDRKIQTAFKTNQTVGFVALPSKNNLLVHSRSPF